MFSVSWECCGGSPGQTSAHTAASLSFSSFSFSSSLSFSSFSSSLLLLFSSWGFSHHLLAQLLPVGLLLLLRNREVTVKFLG